MSSKTTTQSTKTKRRNQRRHNSSKSLDKEKSDHDSITDAQANKDRFIDLAQAALEEADIEEERKGVIHEVMEALIAKTGAPLVAEVISEQLRSQDVIERLAELHEEERQRLNDSPLMSRADSTDSINSLKEPDEEFEDKHDELFNERSHSPEPTIVFIAEYLWRFFRVLILSSVVGLVYHFLSSDINRILIK